MMHLMYKISCILIFFLIPEYINGLEGPVIHIIRHAEVDAESHGWCSSAEAFKFRMIYNNADIREFDPGPVLKKINDPEKVDTVFCSPQKRALQTAFALFDDNAILSINDNLRELQYPVIKWPVIRMPARAWLTASMIFWMDGNNTDSLPSYRERKQNLEKYSSELIAYAERKGEAIVVAHGVINRELIRILKKKGWKHYQKEGYGNLSVNSLKR